MWRHNRTILFSFVIRIWLAVHWCVYMGKKLSNNRHVRVGLCNFYIRLNLIWRIALSSLSRRARSISPNSLLYNVGEWMSSNLMTWTLNDLPISRKSVDRRTVESIYIKSPSNITQNERFSRLPNQCEVVLLIFLSLQILSSDFSRCIYRA